MEARISQFKLQKFGGELAFGFDFALGTQSQSFCILTQHNV